MSKTAARLVALAAVALGVVFLHALVHEGSHALTVFLCGGTVTEFQVNFLKHSPHISYTGVSDPMQKALISLGGSALPLVLILPLALVLRRARSTLVQGASLLFLAGLLPSMLVSAVVTLSYGLGAVQPSEDVAKFLLHSGANPFATAGAFLSLFVAALVLLLKVGRAREACRQVIQVLRGAPQERRQMLWGRVFTTVLLVAVGAVAFRNAISWQSPDGPALTYHTRLDVDLAEIGPGANAFYTFQVQEPTRYDFVYSVDAQSEITLRLVDLQGKPFAFSGSDSMVMFQGTRTQPLGYFTGFTLREGNYALEVSPGSAGSLTVYIDSGAAEPEDLWFLQLLEELSAGTFTAQSYQEEGYELVYEGELSVGRDELLATVPGGPGRMVSAFAAGSGDVSLVYSAPGEIHTLLEGTRATMGRWLPPHEGRGELRASVQNAPVTLYIYIRLD